MTPFTESEVEAAALEWLEGVGWKVAHGTDVASEAIRSERSDYTEIVLERRLRDALARLNPNRPAEALDDAFRKITRPEGSTLEARNRALHRLLADGATVEYRTGAGAMRGAQVSALDYRNPANNDWLAVNQFTVAEGERERRPDIVLFVNGLPLGLIELKNPADEKATVWTAWNQIQTYKPNSRTCPASTPCSSYRTVSRRARGLSQPDASGSSLGARSPGKRRPDRTFPRCG